MPNPPPSIGDGDRAEYRLLKEEYPLPATRREVVAAVETILNAGMVQKLVVEVTQPIKVFRLVHKDELQSSPPQDLPADDLWGRVRNGRMEELATLKTWGAFQVLFEAFATVTHFKMKPARIFVPSLGQLREWLGIDKTVPLSQLYCVDIEVAKGMPQDCCILAAVSYDEANSDALGLRIPIDLPKKEGGKK